MKNISQVMWMMLVIAIVHLVSCKKKGNPAPVGNITGNVPTGTLFLHLHNYIDATEIDGYNLVYTNTYGRKISISTGQFYLSNFELIKLDGSVYSIPDSIVLKLQEQETFQVADVPVGNYKSISFYIGLDEKTNKSLPGASAVLNRSEMWYGSTAQPEGYIFLKLQGKIDTTQNAGASESEMQPFRYLLGTKAAYKKITMPDQNYTISPGQVQYVHLYADYNRMFTGIDLRNKNNLSIITSSDNQSAVAAKLISNLNNLFSYEE